MNRERKGAHRDCLSIGPRILCYTPGCSKKRGATTKHALTHYYLKHALFHHLQQICIQESKFPHI